jgi:hypothetical protein
MMKGSAIFRLVHWDMSANVLLERQRSPAYSSGPERQYFDGASAFFAELARILVFLMDMVLTRRASGESGRAPPILFAPLQSQACKPYSLIYGLPDQ